MDYSVADPNGVDIYTEPCGGEAPSTKIAHADKCQRVRLIANRWADRICDNIIRYYQPVRDADLLHDSSVVGWVQMTYDGSTASLRLEYVPSVCPGVC